MATKKKELTAGDKAPEFELPSDLDGKVRLSAFKGKIVVLYFYPKDDTTGCTREAIDFTTAQKSFARSGAVVIGVSKDSIGKHAKFREKHKLTVQLASDEAGATIAAYGSWVEKSLYGRKYMGIDRSTFLIDSTGAIRQIWRKVRVPGHVEEVLDAVKALKIKK